VPTTQFPQTGFSVAVRTTSDPTAHASDVRAAVRSLDPEVPLGVISTVEETLNEQLAERRMVRDLVGLFGGSSLALAALGLYGLLALAVANRTRELGIRLALGAAPSALTRRFVWDALSIAAIGVFAGIAAALALGRTLRSLLFGVAPSDPLTMAGVAALLVVVALAASYIPAKRAASLNPVDVLNVR
jgi:putative ABC transport system permease protein